MVQKTVSKAHTVRRALAGSNRARQWHDSTKIPSMLFCYGATGAALSFIGSPEEPGEFEPEDSRRPKGLRGRTVLGWRTSSTF